MTLIEAYLLVSFGASFGFVLAGILASGGKA